MAKPTGKATTKGKPLLDLSTVEEIEFIKIDKVEHPFANLDNMALRERTKVSNQLTVVLKLILEAADKPLSRNKERNLTAGIKALIPMIIPTCTTKIVDSLNEVQRQEVVMAFFVVRSERLGSSTALQRMAEVEKELSGKKKKGRTGATSSRGSNGSTKRRRR